MVYTLSQSHLMNIMARGAKPLGKASRVVRRAVDLTQQVLKPNLLVVLMRVEWRPWLIRHTY